MGFSYGYGFYLVSAIFLIRITTSSLARGSALHVSVILPNDDKWMFSIHRVAPAIALAMEKVANMSLHPAIKNFPYTKPGYADSKCHISEALNQAFNFYMVGKMSVLFGPCCDYAAAPVARQIGYWNLPVITAGAMARDFARRGSYPLLTRVGPNFNSLSRAILDILAHFHWNKVKLIYEPDGHKDVIEKFCHLAADGLHQDFLRTQRYHPNFQHDYFKFLDWSDFGDRMATEIGKEYGGECIPLSPTFF